MTSLKFPRRLAGYGPDSQVKFPMENPEVCSIHKSSEVEPDCRNCRISSFTPRPWQEKLSRVICGMINDVGGGKGRKAGRATLLEFIRRVHRKTDGTPYQDPDPDEACDCRTLDDEVGNGKTGHPV